MVKVLAQFMGDGGQLQSYDPANLLIILDNSRNMRRTLELVAQFDSDTFAGQRVRAFEVKNGRPSAISPKSWMKCSKRIRFRAAKNMERCSFCRLTG